MPGPVPSNTIRPFFAVERVSSDRSAGLKSWYELGKVGEPGATGVDGAESDEIETVASRSRGQYSEICET